MYSFLCRLSALYKNLWTFAFLVPAQQKFFYRFRLDLILNSERRPKPVNRNKLGLFCSSTKSRGNPGDGRDVSDVYLNYLVGQILIGVLEKGELPVCPRLSVT